jgi:hypothetical protein
MANLEIFKTKNMFHIACNAIKQMRGLQKTMIIEDAEDNALNSNDNERVDGGAQNKKGEKRKKKKSRTHELLAKIFYMAKLKESKTIF